MPGAELEELIDRSTWKGKVAVKLGAIALTYATTVVVHDRDDANRVVVLKADAHELRGRGAANAEIRSAIIAAPNGGAHVDLRTDLMVSGAVARNARGMIGDISERLTAEFASCLSARISGSNAPARQLVQPGGPPIGGVRMGIWALARAVRRFAARVWNSLRSILSSGE
jgi:carbon monoxide dehydrogenase subunit G